MSRDLTGHPSADQQPEGGQVGGREGRRGWGWREWTERWVEEGRDEEMEGGRERRRGG